jgi:hypothetical protein
LLDQLLSLGPLLVYGLLQFTCFDGHLDTYVVGVADRPLHMPAVGEGASLHTEVVKLISFAVAEGGGPGVVVGVFKARGCNDKGVFKAGTGPYGLERSSWSGAVGAEQLGVA